MTSDSTSQNGSENGEKQDHDRRLLPHNGKLTSAEQHDHIPEDDWTTIVSKIYSGDCVAFLGAGVNAPCGDDDSLPGGAEVALQLLQRMLKRTDEVSEHAYGINWKNIKEYRDDVQEVLREFAKLRAQDPPLTPEEIDLRLRKKILAVLPDEAAKVAHVIFDESLAPYDDLTRVALQDLARVSLRYKRNRNLPDFVNELKKIIPDTDRKPSRLLRILADMPFRLIVTTNYDRLMERSLELFTEADIINSDKLTLAINSSNKVANFVREMISKPAYAALSKYDPADSATFVSAAVWTEELNHLIQQYRPFLLDKTRLGGDVKNNERELYKRPANNEEVTKNRQLLERSFPEALRNHAEHKPYELIVQRSRPVDGTQTNRITKVLSKILSKRNGLVLYKLHGTFTDAPEPAVETRPIITEEDYIEFLTFVGGTGENIDHQITALIQSGTLLFLGYSLEDWNFRALFKGLIEKQDTHFRPRSYAIQKKPSQFWVSVWGSSERNVQILNVDLCQFGEELKERYEAYRKQQEEKVRASETSFAAQISEIEKQREERRKRSGRL